MTRNFDLSLTPRFVWHYTTGQKLALIQRSGAILPIRSRFASPSERPVVWLSLAQTWEKTSAKAMIVPGAMIRLTMAQTARYCGGLVRIGFESECIPLTFQDFRRLSGISSAECKGLAIAGREQGANPDEWRVSFEPLGCDAWKKVETWSGDSWQETLANLKR